MAQNNFEKYTNFKQYSSGAFNSGNPSVDMLLQQLAAMLGGSAYNISPRSIGGRSIYEGYLQRERSRDFANIVQGGFGEMPAMQMFGPMNKSSLTYRAVASMMGQPDSPFMRMMTPFNGGNPMAAQMGLYASMNGMTMDAFGGRAGSANVADTNRMMQTMYSNMFHQRAYSQNDANTVQAGYVKKMQNMVLNNTSAAAVIGPNVAGSDASTKSYQDAIGKRLNDIDKAILEESRKGHSAILDDLKKQQRELVSAQRIVSDARSGIASSQALVNTGFMRPTGVDFSKTRGFNIEEFTRAYSSSAGFQLFDGRKKGLTGGFESFLNKGANDVMDAARGTFGLTNGSEIMEALNQFIGSGTHDLGNAKDNQKLAQTLRDVKSAARTAGISIDSILGIIKEGQMLASSHPHLQYMSGVDIADLSVRSIQKSSAMSAAMGSGYTRRAGGTAGLAQTAQQSALQEQGEPVAQKAMAALFQLDQMSAKAGPAQKAQIKSAKDMIINNASNPAMASKNNFAQLIMDAGNMAGVNGFAFLQSASDDSIAALASANADYHKTGQAYSRQTVMSQLNADLGEGRLVDIAAHMDKHGVNFAQAMAAHPDWYNPHAASLYRYNPFAVDDALLSMNPKSNYSIAEQIRKSRVTNMTKADKDAAEKLAHLHSSTFSNMVSNFMKGELSVDSIKDSISDPKGKQILGSHMDAIKNLSDERSTKAITAAMELQNDNKSKYGQDEVANFTKVSANMGLEDILKYTGSDSDILRAKSFAAASKMLSKDGTSKFGNKKFSNDDLINAVGADLLTSSLDIIREDALGPLRKKTEGSIISGNEEAQKRLNYKKGSMNYNDFWGAQAQMDSRYVKWNKGKRVGFDINQYEKDLKAGTVDGALQGQVQGFMGEYDVMSKSYSDMEAKLKKDFADNGDSVMKNLSQVLDIFSRSLPGIEPALKDLNSILTKATTP